MNYSLDDKIEMMQLQIVDAENAIKKRLKEIEEFEYFIEFSKSNINSSKLLIDIQKRFT